MNGGRHRRPPARGAARAHHAGLLANLLFLVLVSSAFATGLLSRLATA